MIRSLLPLLLVSCALPEKAPVELDGLSNYLFMTNSDETDERSIEALINLEAWLDANAAVTTSTPYNDRSWTVAALEDENVATLPKRPDRPLKPLVAPAVAWVSPYPIQCHAGVQTLADGKPFEPTAARYDRTFLEVENPQCFVDGDCKTMKTKNDVTRANVFFEASFELWKDFRWVTYEKDGQPRRAFYSRGWFSDSVDSKDGPGGNQLWQSYDLDVWIERGPNEVLRYQVVWTETELFLAGLPVDDDSRIATVGSATDGVFAATDEFIKKDFPMSGCSN